MREIHNFPGTFFLTADTDGELAGQVCTVLDEDPAATFFLLLLPVGVPVDTHPEVSLFF